MTDKRSLPTRSSIQECFLNACEGFTRIHRARASGCLGASTPRSRWPRCTDGDARARPGRCGRGEIVRHCAGLGAAAFGVDGYSPVALELARKMLAGETGGPSFRRRPGNSLDAKLMPFPDGSFDRVLIFDGSSICSRGTRPLPAQGAASPQSRAA